jgi:hypothetical protein
MAKRVLLIHGWGNKPEDNWYPWLKSELERQGYEVFAPSMPNSDNPEASEWINCMNETLGTPTKSDYLVGHSLGVIAILRYLEQLKPGQEIGGAVLVAGFSYDIGIKEHHSFFTSPVNWDAVMSHCKRFIAIHSDNDKYVQLVHGDIMKEKLGAKLIIKHNMGHFSKSSGITQFPDALNAVLELSR